MVDVLKIIEEKEKIGGKRKGGENKKDPTGRWHSTMPWLDQPELSQVSLGKLSQPSVVQSDLQWGWCDYFLPQQCLWWWLPLKTMRWQSWVGVAQMLLQVEMRAQWQCGIFSSRFFSFLFPTAPTPAQAEVEKNFRSTSRVLGTEQQVGRLVEYQSHQLESSKWGVIKGGWGGVPLLFFPARCSSSF